ncbi:formate-dependent phosphoribosylglycinamide formyltransferase [Thermovibrio ammonificans]|jgi:phosphoribosylglycinamide formyltransferase 2|uniref:Formate-dependent phosphoribosylglycinamide formyltransferase n=1 Tax=Thermovibrio ammonificans (strain DSM 15698 / JCM 12110 / HB-1) TaxID=648996 RepID=E8T2W6_THEA1|nr:formate-dependent phosphoribosylglycinamide formyltransferase [Thermovibrio ammonificans]ADU97175.1 phosphoribosylglycinamide formyltransferase 2 [Thermovibrio ammonificans HB-1]
MRIGTPLAHNATKVMLLGSGELGKEFAIEAMRLGLEVIAVDSYQFAPAQQVAHRYYVIDMRDGRQIRNIVYREKPDFIVPEIEAIDTDMLVELEKEGFTVVPCARATKLTMDRIGIRRLAAEELGLKTSAYRFAETFEEFKRAVEELGYPVVVKPVMSSSGKGQSVVREPSQLEWAFRYAKENARGKGNALIIEEFINFDFEITLLTVRTRNQGTLFCEPIGHRQVDGDYHESWQPQPMSEAALKKAKEMAKAVTDALGGYGIFGCEFFVKGDEVWFSEVSPRPHDTGMVTMASQNMSEFEIHLRAILGLPIHIELISPGASYCFHGTKNSVAPAYEGVAQALEEPNVWVRIFGKPTTRPRRRMGVVVARGETVEEARRKAKEAAERIKVVENG